MDNDYRYFDITPNGESNEMNCVTRAMSVSIGIPYSSVQKLLKMTAEKFDCDALCVCCYHRLLEWLFDYDVHYCTTGETVGNIAKKYDKNILLIRIDGHLTCAIYGTVVDIWDCTREKVDCFWIVK